MGSAPWNLRYALVASDHRLDRAVPGTASEPQRRWITKQTPLAPKMAAVPASVAGAQGMALPSVSRGPSFVSAAISRWWTDMVSACVDVASTACFVLASCRQRVSGRMRAGGGRGLWRYLLVAAVAILLSCVAGRRPRTLAVGVRSCVE